MSKEKETKPDFSNYYTYLSKASKKDFVGLVKSVGGLLQLTDDIVMCWNFDNNLELMTYQLDDLLHIAPAILDVWGDL